MTQPEFESWCKMALTLLHSNKANMLEEILKSQIDDPEFVKKLESESD